MKQHFFFAAMASFAAWTMANQAHGQITVDEGDLPQGGTAYTFQNLVPDVLFDYDAAGPGWVWDFSELDLVDSTVVEVQDIADAPFTAQFVFNGFDPEYQADHFYTFLNVPDLGDLGGDMGGEIPIELEEVVGYHQTAGGTYNQIGVGLSVSGFELPIPFDDIDEVFPVPLTADATLESTAAYTVEVPTTLTYVVDQTRVSVVDGYGTLLLPDGSSHEVLRLKSTVTSDDSVYIDLAEQGFAFERETVTYTWLSDGGMPWMEVSTTLGVPTLARYQGSAPSAQDTSSTMVVEPGALAALFPNPVTSGCTVRLGEDASATWRIFPASGQQSRTVQGAVLRTADMAPGVYLIQNEATGVTRRLVVR